MSPPAGSQGIIVGSVLAHIPWVIIGVYFENYDTVYSTGKDSVNNFFKLGSRVFAKSNSASYSRVGVIWTDTTNHVIWDSQNGDNSASKFSIDDESMVMSSKGTVHEQLTISFECKIYDGSGNSKSITNGKFYGEFGY